MTVKPKKRPRDLSLKIWIEPLPDTPDNVAEVKQ